jgi:hypothetical protein
MLAGSLAEWTVSDNGKKGSDGQNRVVCDKDRDSIFRLPPTIILTLWLEQASFHEETNASIGSQELAMRVGSMTVLYLNYWYLTGRVYLVKPHWMNSRKRKFADCILRPNRLSICFNCPSSDLRKLQRIVTDSLRMNIKIEEFDAETDLNYELIYRFIIWL